MKEILRKLLQNENSNNDLFLPKIKVNQEVIDEMIEEIREAGHPFKPTEFWEDLNNRNLQQLNMHGVNNFKRTVNQNYYNWLPQGLHDNQMASLIAFWAKQPSMLPLKVKFKTPGFFDSTVSENLFLNKEYADIYRLFVGFLWYYTLKTDHYGIAENLSEPELGNPFKIELESKLISQDLANSIRERNTNYDFFDKSPSKTHVIGELGAGYGRLGYVFLATTKCKYLIFDIPPALYVSQWYLSSLMKEKEIFSYRHFKKFDEISADIEKADIGFFTPNQLALFPDGYFDSLISISSLHEMTASQVEAYKNIIRNKVLGTVYFKQWLCSQNPYLERQLEKAQYVLGGDWNIVLDRADPVQDQFFEMLFRKA